MTKGLMNKETIKDIGVNVCRFVVALTFVFSGYVKAVDLSLIHI